MNLAGNELKGGRSRTKWTYKEITTNIRLQTTWTASYEHKDALNKAFFWEINCNKMGGADLYEMDPRKT